jgi:hypothetical protein
MTIERRWLLATQLLNGCVTVGALVMIALIVQQPERLTQPEWVIWCIVIIGGFHTLEEYTLPGGFIRWFNRDYFASDNDDFPLSTRKAFLTDSLAGIAIVATVAFVGTSLYWLSLGFVSLMFVNGMVHIADSITRGRYSPGVVTSVLFNVPLGGYIIYFYLSGGYAGLVDIAVAYGIGLLGHVLFYRTIRADMAAHPSRLQVPPIGIARGA